MEVEPGAYADDIRDAEAQAVAELCHRLLVSLQVRGAEDALVPLTPGGIALLAPTTTDLWRYERALEALDIPFASQAGRNLFRRQEVQDLLTLARTLADPRDTMAFGALMRGPLVGLSEEELLDVAAALPADPDRPGEHPRFSMTTDVEHVSHPIARKTLGLLQELRRRARSLTPSLLLGGGDRAKRPSRRRYCRIDIAVVRLACHAFGRAGSTPNPRSDPQRRPGAMFEGRHPRPIVARDLSCFERAASAMIGTLSRFQNQSKDCSTRRIPADIIAVASANT